MLITLLRHRHANRRMFELELLRHTTESWMKKLPSILNEYEYGVTVKAGPPPQDHGIAALGRLWPAHTAQMVRPQVLGRLRLSLGDVAGQGDLVFLQRETQDPSEYSSGLYLVFNSKCHSVQDTSLRGALEEIIWLGQYHQRARRPNT